MTWKDISIAKYQAAHNVLISDLNLFDKNIALVSLIYGIDNDIILKLPFKKFAELLEGIKFLEDLETIDKRFPKYFTCGTKVFRTHTINKNIPVEQIANIIKFSFGQFIDIDSFDSKGRIDNLHNILAIFCRPLFSKYDGKKHAEHAALFKEKLSMAVAYPIALFFWGAGQRLRPAMDSYLDKSLSKAVAQATEALQKTMGGSSPLTSSQEAWEGTGASF